MQITNNKQQETLNRIKEEYCSRQNKVNMDNTKPDLLAENLKTGVKTSLTSRLYRAKTRKKTQNKNNFSATKKWLHQGFNYPRDTIEKSASTIQKMKIPGNYKAKLLKHNLAGYVLPKVLVKLGINKDNKCPNCTEMEVDFQHIFHDCCIAEFLKQQISSMFKEFHKQDPRINIHDLQMFNQKKFINRTENEDIKYVITAMKITLYNNYQSKQTM